MKRLRKLVRAGNASIESRPVAGVGDGLPACFTALGYVVPGAKRDTCRSPLHLRAMGLPVRLVLVDTDARERSNQIPDWEQEERSASWCVPKPYDFLARRCLRAVPPKSRRSSGPCGSWLTAPSSPAAPTRTPLLRPMGGASLSATSRCPRRRAGYGAAPT